ncbi:MAG: hypothetical protein LUD81_07905 [Clostridiales bacterium]|nr:hypothetical protein [Clostridiales bacterium]
MFEILNRKQRKQDIPFNFSSLNVPVGGGTKQVTVTEKSEYYSYVDELTGEVVTLRRSVRTESRERISVVREQRRFR